MLIGGMGTTFLVALIGYIWWLVREEKKQHKGSNLKGPLN